MPLLIRTFYVKGQGIRVKKGVATKVKTLKGKKKIHSLLSQLTLVFKLKLNYSNKRTLD